MASMSFDEQKLATFAHELGVRFVVLYGSHALGSSHAESDVDIAIYLEPEQLEHFDHRAYGAILDGFRTLGICDTKLDLVVLNTANILLRYEITLKGKLLYGDPLAYIQYCGFAYRDYIDAKPLFELENFLILKRQEFIQQHATR